MPDDAVFKSHGEHQCQMWHMRKDHVMTYCRQQIDKWNVALNAIPPPTNKSTRGLITAFPHETFPTHYHDFCKCELATLCWIQDNMLCPPHSFFFFLVRKKNLQIWKSTALLASRQILSACIIQRSSAHFSKHYQHNKVCGCKLHANVSPLNANKA